MSEHVGRSKTREACLFMSLTRFPERLFGLRRKPRDSKPPGSLISSCKISAFDLATFSPSVTDIQRNGSKMPAPARTLSSGMRIVQKSPRSSKAAEQQSPATMPILEDRPAVVEESYEDVLMLERGARDAMRRRNKELSSLQPKNQKVPLRGLKPTRSGGGIIKQPGGGARGN